MELDNLDILFSGVDNEVVDGIEPYIPSQVKAYTLSDLSAAEREHVELSANNLDTAFNPWTNNLRSALLVYKNGTSGFKHSFGSNNSASNGVTFCAEKEALQNAMITDGDKEAHSIIVTTKRNVVDNVIEPAVAPCGSCRNAINGFAQTDRALNLSASTLLISASSDFKTIFKGALGDIMPFIFMDEDISQAELEMYSNLSGLFVEKNSLKDISIPYSCISDVQEFCREGVQGADVNRLMQLADEKLKMAKTGSVKTRIAASVLTLNNRLYGAPAFHGNYPERGGPAPIRALKTARNEGDSMFKAMLILTEGKTNFGGPFSVDGYSMQYMFDAAQLSGVDFPVILARKDFDKVFICSVSKLFPLGEGVLNSNSAFPSVSKYRLLDNRLIK